MRCLRGRLAPPGSGVGYVERTVGEPGEGAGEEDRLKASSSEEELGELGGGDTKLQWLGLLGELRGASGVEKREFLG